MLFRHGEVRHSLTGAWELFKGRAEGMRFFDTSLEGFWRSFGVIVLLAIPLAISVLAEQRIMHDPAAGGVPVDVAADMAGEIGVNAAMGPYVLAKAIGFGVDWISYPLLLALLAKPLGFATRYVPYVVARNWSAAISILPYTVVALLYLSGALTPMLAGFLSFICFGVVLRYHYVIARAALDCTFGMALGLVTLDTVLSLFVTTLVNRVAGI